jgi:hypothetical protein
MQAKRVKKGATSARKGAEGKLAPRVMAFVREYAKDPNGKQAAIRAGYAPKAAHVQASQLLSNVNVQSELAKLRGKAAAKAEITVEDIARRYLAMADADPNDLIQFRRRCCRYCYGKGHGYQWTAREYKEAMRLYPLQRIEWDERKPEYKRLHATQEPQAPDASGGMGFDPRLDPAPDCPECFGEGVESPYMQDTRKLSKEALSLYGGIEVTEKGHKVILHKKPEALNKLGEHLGMFKMKAEITGKGGGPIIIQASPTDERL